MSQLFAKNIITEMFWLSINGGIKIQKQIDLKFIQYIIIHSICMNKIQFVLLAALAIVTVGALRVGNGDHLVYQNSTEYLKGLQDQQSRFQASINALDDNVDQTLATAQGQTDIQKKIAIIEQGILNQENMIFNTSTTLIPVLVIKDQCVGLTEADKSRIVAKCEATIGRIQQLKNSLSALPQDLRTRELQASADHQIQYLSTLRDVVINNCTTSVILSPTVYQSNVAAPNWIPGQKDMTGIVNEYIARSQQNSNITNCPLSAPFLINGKCDNCPQGQIYDMSTSTCTTCPPNTVFSELQKKCKESTTPIPNPPQPNPPNPNPEPTSTGNTTNKRFVDRTFGPVPENTPFDIQCPVDAPFYNLSLNGCSHCPEPEYFNYADYKCYMPNTNNPLQASRVIGNSTQVLPDGTVRLSCPDQLPFYWQGKCVECPTERPLFNQENGQCAQCNVGYVYDQTKKMCVFSHPVSTNITQAKTQKYIGVLPTIQPNETTPCPADKPFLDTNQNQCVACPPSSDPQATVFNVTSGQCTRCDTYEQNLHICAATNHVSAQEKGYIGALQPVPPNATQCPPTHPFYSAKAASCVSCGDGYFVVQTQGCARCNTNNAEFYDVNLHKCVTMNYVAANQNQYVGGNLTNTQPSNTNPCPANMPFYSLKLRTCINCTGQTPVFDLSTGTCIKCPDFSSYNATTKTCGQHPLSTNIEAAKNADYVGALPATQAPNTTPCPPQAPFLTNTGKCTNCKEDPNLPIFNITKGECTACPSYYVYNPSTKTCDTPVTNSSATNYIGNPPQVNTSAPQCPLSAPYFSTLAKTCVACPPPEDPTLVYFNFNTQRCAKCDAGYAYNETTKNCTFQYPKFTNVTQAATQKYIGSLPPSQPQNTTPCSAETPFFDTTTKQCVACPTASNPEANIFDTTKGHCVKCDSYQINLHICASTNTTAAQQKGYLGSLPQPIPNTTLCPASTPFYNNKTSQCTLCTSGFFDFSTGDCTHCGDGEGYDPNLKKCVATNVQVASQKPYINGNLSETQPNNPCPDSTPFYSVHFKSCVSCSDPYLPIFDISIGECVKCKDSEGYDVKAHKCLATNVVVANQQQYINGILPNVQPVGTTPCPTDTPYYSRKDSTCVGCTPEAPIFDLSTSSCIQCPQFQAFNVTSKTCTSYPKATNVQAAKNGSFIGTLPDTQPANTAPCPAATPFLTKQGKCTNCSQYTNLPIFDLTKSECSACPNFYLYNPETRQCQTPVTNPAATNYIGTPNNQTNQTNATLCPLTAPFFSNVTGSCINCPPAANPSLKYFNFETQNCAQCPTGEVFDSNTHACHPPLPYVHNLAAKTWISQSPYKAIDQNHQQLATGQYQPCPYNPQDPPNNKPYYDPVQKRCISCPTGQYYFLETHLCVNCPAGTVFQQKYKKCVRTPVPFQTDYLNDTVDQNLVTNNTDVTPSQLHNPSLTECKDPTPYFNGVRCITCSDPYPYFNIQIMDCVDCKEPSQKVGYQCISSQGQTLSPDLSSLTENVFTRHAYQIGGFARHRIQL